MDVKEKLINKTRKIFLIEYLAIAAILLVIGFLKLFNVIPYNEQRVLVYNIITLIGTAWIFFDLGWFIVSKKKRERNDLIDKIFPFIAAIFLLVFDILVLAKIRYDADFIKYSISSVLIYAGIVSLAMGIYRYFKPSKMIMLAIEEEYQNKIQALSEQKEENKEESTEK